MYTQGGIPRVVPESYTHRGIPRVVPERYIHREVYPGGTERCITVVYPGVYVGRHAAQRAIPPLHPFHCWARILPPFTRFTVGLGMEVLSLLPSPVSLLG